MAASGLCLRAEEGSHSGDALRGNGGACGVRSGGPSAIAEPHLRGERCRLARPSSSSPRVTGRVGIGCRPPQSSPPRSQREAQPALPSLPAPWLRALFTRALLESERWLQLPAAPGSIRSDPPPRPQPSLRSRPSPPPSPLPPPCQPRPAPLPAAPASARLRRGEDGGSGGDVLALHLPLALASGLQVRAALGTRGWAPPRATGRAPGPDPGGRDLLARPECRLGAKGRHSGLREKPGRRP